MVHLHVPGWQVLSHTLEAPYKQLRKTMTS